ncbi:hypothetical protein J4558_14395 [Leptolyngbya sp. 15MV]|nr:hypothetical protein J4558_14395 [Leptolyngbya sp. 15MV]
MRGDGSARPRRTTADHLDSGLGGSEAPGSALGDGGGAAPGSSGDGAGSGEITLEPPSVKPGGSGGGVSSSIIAIVVRND